MAADLEFRIGAELTEIKGALASLRRDFAAVGQSAQQAGGRNALQGLEGGAKSALGTIGRLAAGFASLAGAIQLIGAADELNTLNARLRLVTGSTEEFASAQVKVFELAQRTRSSLSETITLYARIAQATKEAGVGQGVLLEVVETINQAVQLSGASTQAAEAALIQLGQGLASGTLRGEELNSVLEQTPALADAIAKGMGITRDQLRKFGQDGKISAEQVIKALQAQRGEVAAQFAQLPLTVGQSVTLLKNAGLQLVGAFDTASGATGGLARVIKGLADFLQSDEAVGAILEFAATWSGAFEQIVKDAGEAVQLIREATADITGQGEDLIGLLGRAFRELPVNIRTSIRIVTVNIAALVDRVIAEARFVKEAIAAIFSDDTIDAAAARYRQRLAAIEQAAQDSIDGALADRDGALKDAAAARQQAQAARNAARAATGSRAAGNFRRTATDEQKRAAEALRKAQLDAEEKLAEDSAKRQLGTLQNLYDDARLAASEYFAAREAIELAAIDRSIALERERAAAGGTERVKALAQIELLERQKGDIQRKAARDTAEAQKAIDRELEQARAQDLENAGQGAAAARIRLEAQFRDLIARLQAAGNVEGVKLIQRLIDTGVAQAQFDQIKAQFDKTLADLRARQQAIADQQATGALTPDAARAQQADAQQQTVAKLRELNAELQLLAADPKALPAIKAAAEEANRALKQLEIDGMTGVNKAAFDLRASLANLQEGFAQSATGAGVDALTGFFTDLASGTKSAGDALKDFVRGFAASMAQIAARALATYLVLQLLEAIFPGAGKLVAASGGVGFGGNDATGFVQHRGGMAGTGPRRRVNPLVFAGAPRFHSGSGVLGLKPDEIPAILQTGERVQSRAEVAAAASGQGGTRVVNVIDPNLVQDYLTTPAGERVVLNVIERNSGAIRAKLA